MNSFLTQVFLLSPLWSLSLLAFIPLTAKILNNNQELKQEVVCLIYALAFLLSLTLLCFLGFNDKEVLSLRFDPYSSGACVLGGGSAFISLAFFYLNPWLDKKQLTEILFFFSQSLVGLYVFCLAQDLMTAFIGIEIVSLILYINLAMSRKDLFCLEAAIKYFVLSSLSSVIFLYGMSFLFGAAGTLEFNTFFAEQNRAFIYNRFFFMGFCLVFASLFFKVALFPFQFWLADVYQGALTPLTFFMATGVKSSVVLFLGKMFALPFFEKGAHGSVFLTGLALASVLTVLFGNIMALKQIKLKRLVAFSSLAHSGYLMMTLFGILNVVQSSKDFSILFYYLIAYIFLTGGLLLVIQSLEREGSQIELKDIKALFTKNSFLAVSLSIFLLGLAGIPPTFGFFAKIGVFQSLILSGSWWLLFWAFVGSALGLYYYIKPISLMLGHEEKKEEINLSKLAKLLLALLLFLSLFGAFSFWPVFLLIAKSPVYT